MMKRNNNKQNSVKNDNREILVILYVFMAMFIGLIAYLVVFTYRDGSTVVNSSYNKRLNMLANHVYRGSIYANDESEIAFTDVDDDGNDRRVYPYGRLFAHAVGYSSHGGLGIESMYAYTMLTSNENIFLKVKNDLTGVKNQGNNIYSTLDPYLTLAASDALGDRRGAVVVTNIKTGEILAIVSKPDFDPNSIDEMWDEYNSSDTGTLLNRATMGLYPPGSTFKIVTALEYIKEHEDSSQYDYLCKGSFSLDGATINCYHGQKHGEVDFKKSFAKSCNSSFANITSSLNKVKFSDTCEELLFGKELPCPYTYKKSTVSISKKTVMEDMLQSGIGQGATLVTPVHMNLITAAIGNEGVLMTPYVVKKVTNADGDVISETKPKTYMRLLTEDNADELTELMAAVVTEGTGTRLRDDVSYRAAGKTGSAEYSQDKNQSHAWFTGFAPVDDPEIAVTVIVEGGGSGGETAVPIARAVFDTYFE